MALIFSYGAQLGRLAGWLAAHSAAQSAAGQSIPLDGPSDCSKKPARAKAGTGTGKPGSRGRTSPDSEKGITGAGTGSGINTGAGPEFGPRIETETEIGTEIGTGIGTGSDIEIGARIGAGTGTETRAGTGTEISTGTGAGSTSGKRAEQGEELSIQLLGPAWTHADHDLDFLGFSPLASCATATLTAGRGRPIFGILWQTEPSPTPPTPSTWPSLPILPDSAQESPHHAWSLIQVVRPETPLHVIAAAVSLLGSPEKAEAPGKTELIYVVHLLAGLRAFGAPAEYIDYVKLRIICSNPRLLTALDAF